MLTCKTNSKDFASDKLQVYNKSESGVYKKLLDKRLEIEIKHWKDSKTFQVLSIVKNIGISNIQRSKSSNMIEVRFTKNGIMYQDNMGGVDCGINIE